MNYYTHTHTHTHSLTHTHTHTYPTQHTLLPLDHLTVLSSPECEDVMDHSLTPSASEGLEPDDPMESACDTNKYTYTQMPALNQMSVIRFITK